MLPPGSGVAKATMTLANRWVTTRQMALLLGFMGQRVLGQYDIALLSAETTPGRLLFVEENIRQTARVMDVPLPAVPDLDRPARDDARLRVRGASVAAPVPRRAARAPAQHVQLGREVHDRDALTSSEPPCAAMAAVTTSTGWNG